MKYLVTAVLSLVLGGGVGWYVTRLEQKLEDTEGHLKFLTSVIQSQQGRSFK